MFSLLLSSAFTESRPFLPLTTSPASRLGAHKKLGGDTAGTADPNWPKGYSIPYDVAQHIKLGEEEGRGGCSEWWHFVFPGNRYVWRSPAFLEMAEHLPADGKRWMTSLFCFACMCSFCFPYETVFISTHEFSHFYPSDSLPHPTGGEWVSGCVVLSCQLRLNLLTTWHLFLKKMIL